MRRPEFSKGALLVVLAVLAAAVAGVAAIQGLESGAVSARDDESKLLTLRLDLMRLRDMPYDAAPGSGVPVADARGELLSAQRSIARRIEDLRDDDLPNDARIRLHFTRGANALWVLFAGVRAKDDQKANTAADTAAVQLYAADGAMGRAATVYRSRAAHALARARLGSTAIVALLFALFAWFYLRSWRARHERERLFREATRLAEDERLRLASDLHDGPIQQLTVIAMQLDLATVRGDEALDELVVATRTAVGQQVETLRELMVDLRPPALDEVGLTGALRDYAARFEQRTGIRVELDADLDKQLGPDVVTTLYRVAQEALTNVWKHADAHAVKIVLRNHGARVVLAVEDDGAGFVAGSATTHGHVGLALMQERVERAGGRWRLSSTPGRGTLVEAVLPS